MNHDVKVRSSDDNDKVRRLFSKKKYDEREDKTPDLQVTSKHAIYIIC